MMFQVDLVFPSYLTLYHTLPSRQLRHQIGVYMYVAISRGRESVM